MRRYVAVGINTGYGDPSADLAGCRPDLTERYLPDLEAAGFEEGVTLYDGDATKANIVEALHVLGSATRAGDTLAFIMSSHGSYVTDRNGDEPDRRDEVLCCAGCLSGDFEANCIKDDELAEMIRHVPRGADLIGIFDACHSQSMSRFMGDPTATRTRIRFLPNPNERPQPMGPAGIARALLFGRRRGEYVLESMAELVISGCEDGQTSADAFIDGAWTGAMSYYLSKLWREDPRQPARQLHARLLHDLRRAGYSQTASLSGSPARAQLPLYGAE